MSETTRRHRTRRGAGVVERGGLENCRPEKHRLIPLEAAWGWLTRFCRDSVASIGLRVRRWDSAGTAWLARASSEVQRTRLFPLLVRDFHAARPLVARVATRLSSREPLDEAHAHSAVTILSVAQAMRRSEAVMEGFEVEDRELPTPLIPVETETKETMALALCAIVHGATPEDLAGYLDGAFPHEVIEALERAGERDEMWAHVDLLVRIQQSPSVA